MGHHNFTNKELLHIFDLVSSNGHKIQGVWELQGIRVWHDFDGYTCWLAYKDLTVTLLFHGKLDVEYDDIDTISEFANQCKLLTSELSIS